jgi:hypothetical protein
MTWLGLGSALAFHENKTKKEMMDVLLDTQFYLFSMYKLTTQSHRANHSPK